MTSNSKVFIICLAQFFERSFGNVEFDARHTAASMSEKTIEKESILKPDHPFECRDFLLLSEARSYDPLSALVFTLLLFTPLFTLLFTLLLAGVSQRQLSY